MVFLTKPPSLNGYESVNDPTKERSASRSPGSPLIDGEMGNCGVMGVCGECNPPSGVSIPKGNSSESSRFTFLTALFFSPGGNGLSSSR